ncbi:unnamed protein product [Triticum turgidum subsp. durum]|uniref:Major facilitator superfamily (MFS) profile domain-containing protein n=1 Tax=Triticum turgidum subsp. durum TaxID=4567 RepID=A0A9R0Q6I3_TRITD|nr:unnamed protein product [Triticum turgidum subsp. durum]
MSGAVLVAIAASIGNLLQGWDNATIAGAVLYIKKEFSLETQPLIEGLIVAMSLIGATVITTFSGAVADAVGRRPLLIASSVLYFVSGLVMLWAPNVYVLLLARLVDGFGIGLAVTLVPLYISETAPTDIRGLLNTLPQFSGSGGMFLSYCMVFTMSLMPQPDWRIMLGVLSIPSLMYFALTVFYLPESPRWLVSKGRMAEAKRVLQGLRGREDVSGEMALLVEGLGVGKDTHFEEYIIGPDDELADDGLAPDEEKLKLYGAEEGVSWIARPVRGGGQSADGQKEGGFQRIYLHEEGVSGDRRGSILSMPGGDIPPGGEYIQAAALVSQPALYSKDLIEQQLAGPAMVHPSEAVAKGTKWAELFEPGVKHALFVGIGLQILQQFAGINGVLYYTPQILEQAGVGVLLSNIGLSSSSASILISALTTLLMLPSIGIAMRLMDMSGRRFLLLSTIPVLIVALAVLVLVNVLDVGTMVHAALSTISVIVYFCFFVMGFGPIPNILCAEIFPTSVRGICIAICALTFWIGDIIVTYTLPVMLNAIGLAGVFGIYAIVCVLAFVFVYMKVPETKGMPLEVITEFFSVGAKQGKEATD